MNEDKSLLTQGVSPLFSSRVPRVDRYRMEFARERYGDPHATIQDADKDDFIDYISRIADEAQQRSLVDFPTGLGNRYAFDQAFGYHKAERRRSLIDGEKLEDYSALLVLDITMKPVNDSPELGYGKGDELIARTGELLKGATSRSTDVPLRLGGDEIGLFLMRVNDRPRNGEHFIQHLATELGHDYLAMSDEHFMGIPSARMGIYPFRVENVDSSGSVLSVAADTMEKAKIVAKNRQREKKSEREPFVIAWNRNGEFELTGEIWES